MNKLQNVLAAALLFSVGAHAADGYLNDQQGKPVRSTHGHCWRSGSWTPAHANAECDADLIRTHQEVAREVVVIPAPVAATAPMAPAAKPHRRMSMETDALFDFDSAELRPTGHAKLDDVAKTILAAATVESVSVVGHSDRLGSSAYNHRLSLLRAEAIKAALVSKGVQAEWIGVEGKGEEMPLTGTDDCAGKMKTAKLVACLQPDRRVEVEVVLHAASPETDQDMNPATSH